MPEAFSKAARDWCVMRGEDSIRQSFHRELRGLSLSSRTTIAIRSIQWGRYSEGEREQNRGVWHRENQRKPTKANSHDSRSRTRVCVIICSTEVYRSRKTLIQLSQVNLAVSSHHCMCSSSLSSVHPGIPNASFCVTWDLPCLINDESREQE